MSFENREKSAELKFSIEEDKKFRIHARTAKLIGLWAAEKMHLTGDHATNYAKAVVATDMEESGLGDVRRKIVADFKDHGVDVSDHIIDATFEKKQTEATAQIEAETANG